MSSVRISQHRAALGTPTATGADNGRERSEQAGVDASFALALGAAVVAPQSGSAPPFGGQAGDGSDEGHMPRKRGDGPAKPDATLAALVAQDSLASARLPLLALPDNTAGATAVSRQDGNGALTAPAVIDGGATVGRLLAAGPGAARAGPQQPGPPVASADGQPAAVLWSAGAGSTEGQQGAAWPTIAGHDPALALPLAPTAGAISGAGRSLATAASGASQPVPDLAAAEQPFQIVAPAQLAMISPAPITSPADPGVAASINPSGDIDLRGGSPVTGPVSRTPPGANASRPLSPQPLPQGSPAAAPQPGFGGGSGGDAFAGAPRDHFATIAASAGTGDVAAAVAAPASDNTASLAGATGAAPAMPGDATPATAISDQVAGHLVRLVSSGSRDMVMRLRPPELGELTVRVAVSGRDVSAWFSSPQPQVQNAISAAMGQLQASLGDAGYNLNGAWVGADTADARQQRSVPPPSVPAGVAGPSAVPSASIAASRPAASGLNIYV